MLNNQRETTKETLQQVYTEKRKLYVHEGKISHDDFYSWLANEIGIAERHLPFTVERLVKSEDRAFNDTPLKQWDNCDYEVRGRAARAGMKAWSLNDTVCVLKCVARKLVNEAKAKETE